MNQKKPAKNAFAGSRTRVYCLEGNYPNRWTTNACALQLVHIYISINWFPPVPPKPKFCPIKTLVHILLELWHP